MPKKRYTPEEICPPCSRLGHHGVYLNGAYFPRACARGRADTPSSVSRPTRAPSDPLAPPAGRRRRFRFSSPPGLAGPAAHETLLVCGRVVGTEVGFPLVRLKPDF